MQCPKWFKNYYRRNRRTMYHPLRLLGFLGFAMACLYQVGAFLEIYFRYPTSIEISVVNSQTLIFPAVTLCNSNRVRHSEWCLHDPSVCDQRENESLWEYMQRLEERYKWINRTMRIQLGHQEENFIRKCMFDEESCMHMITQFFVFEYTNCFTIHAHWGLGESPVLTASVFRPKAGRATEMVILMNLELGEYSPMTSLKSAKMTIHAPMNTPTPQYDSVNLCPGIMYTYGVIETTVNVLPDPYQSNCRNYTGDYTKRTKATLNQEICMEECSAYRMARQCGCTVHRLSLMYDLRACRNDTERRCLEDFDSWMRNICFTCCRMPCMKRTYEYDTLDVDNFFPGACSSDEPGNNTVEEDTTGNVCLRVFFASTEADIYSHRPRYNPTQVFSAIGGYIGLWLGISFLSVFSYAINLIFSIIKNLFSRRKNKDQKDVNENKNEYKSSRTLHLSKIRKPSRKTWR